MSKKKFAELRPGDELCDMHNYWGLRSVDFADCIVERVKVSNIVGFKTEDSWCHNLQDVVRRQGISYTYTNKLLVVLECQDDDVIVVGYSYDGNLVCFGTLELA